jgi:hypothetical protein
MDDSMKCKVTCRTKRTSTVQMDQRGKTQELIKKKKNPVRAQIIFLCSKISRLALGPTQFPAKWILQFFPAVLEMFWCV